MFYYKTEDYAINKRKRVKNSELLKISKSFIQLKTSNMWK